MRYIVTDIRKQTMYDIYDLISKFFLELILYTQNISYDKQWVGIVAFETI